MPGGQIQRHSDPKMLNCHDTTYVVEETKSFEAMIYHASKIKAPLTFHSSKNHQNDEQNNQPNSTGRIIYAANFSLGCIFHSMYLQVN